MTEQNLPFIGLLYNRCRLPKDLHQVFFLKFLIWLNCFKDLRWIYSLNEYGNTEKETDK